MLFFGFDPCHESNYGLFEAYNNLGRTYERMGQTSEALKYYEKSQELSKKYHSGNVWVEIVALNNMSECYHKMGDLDRARKSLLSAKKNTIKLFGEESEAAARIYNNLVAVYCDLGRWVMAERYYQKAIAINEKIAYTYINKAKQMNIKLYGKDSQSVRDNNYNLKLIKEKMLRRGKK